MSEKSAVVVFKFDGMEYPIDLGDLSGREMGVIKRRVVGVKGIIDVGRNFQAGDTELMAVVVGLAMARSGVNNVDYDRLLDTPSDKFEVLDDDDEENPTDGAGEVTTPAPTGSQSSPESTESSPGSTTT